ncbi:hypothetical protein ABEF95_013240 [Exophiala dermatitidis]
MSATEVLEWLGLSKTSPGVKVTTLPASYFKFPPSPEPTTVPPPTGDPALAHPFTIPTGLYNELLSPNVPLTVALVYMSFVTLMNSVNANRKYKPWAFSRTRLFKLLVILHNTFLALYSVWTCVGMVNALRLSLPPLGEHWKITDTVDALCKLHGPRGVGNAATYNATTSSWTMTNRLLHLAADGLGPERSDVGRLWNEGLAFYGWLFYLSKFYEIFDTCIILAKGRKSSLLQTYHHAGAMISMWAGIRYMSPPIWMFVLVNSGIHAIMYTFYLLAAIGLRMPKWLKQSLTTLQITQFVVGASFAFLHLFVAYQIPVSVPYIYHLGNVASKILSDIPSAASTTLSSAVATASAGRGAWLKKAALRAAGYEGLAENVLNEEGRPFGIDAVHIAEEVVAREETRYRDELQWVHCLDSSGQVFAILLNCMYLLPLTYLFVEFFVTAYLKRIESRRGSTASEKAEYARRSFQDATKGVSRRLSEAVEEMHRTAEDIGDDTVIVDGDEIKRELKQAVDEAKSTIQRGSEKVKQPISGIDTEKVKQEVQSDMEKVRKNLQDTVDRVKTTASQPIKKENKEKAKAAAQNAKDATLKAVNKAADTLKSAAETVKEQAGNLGSEETKEQIKSTASKAAAKAGEIKDGAAASAKQTAEQVSDSARQGTANLVSEDTKKQVESTAGKAAAKANEVTTEAASATKQATDQASEKLKEQASNLTSEETKNQVKSTASKAAAKVDEAKNGALESAKKTTNQASEAAAETVKKAQGATEDAKKEVDKSKQKSKDVKKTPNGNGTGAEGASGPVRSKGKAKTAESSENKEEKQEKKKEDKIIDESQAVRDHDVDAGGNDEDQSKEEASSEVKPGVSFADAVKEDDMSEVKPGVSFADAVRETRFLQRTMPQIFNLNQRGALHLNNWVGMCLHTATPAEIRAIEGSSNAEDYRSPSPN